MRTPEQHAEGKAALGAARLLACPFCGGAAHLRVKHLTIYAENLYWYVCGTKGCDIGFSLGEWKEELARSKWNRRQANDPSSATRP